MAEEINWLEEVFSKVSQNRHSQLSQVFNSFQNGGWVGFGDEIYMVTLL